MSDKPDTPRAALLFGLYGDFHTGVPHALVDVSGVGLGCFWFIAHGVVPLRVCFWALLF